MMDNNYSIKDIDRATAIEILKWRYDDEYRMYNENFNEADIGEMLDSGCLGVTGDDDETVGFFCYGQRARAIDVENIGVYEDESFTDFGLGMKPELCGKGSGERFMKFGLKTGHDRFGIDKYRLSVDESNKRAVRLYEKCGFIKKETFKGVYNGIHAVFLIMQLVFPVDFDV